MASKDIVVIGASAGGVGALKTLVRDLPPNLPAGVFVVLHIGAHPSILPSILSTAGPMPVSHAIDGDPIGYGRIYVAPPDHHLMLARDHMHVTRGPKENNARPSINTLFRTAANAYGDRVVGVVLTGELNDGTVGLWEIKRHGGITIVQDPAEAAYPSMPRSVLEHVGADYTLPVSEIPKLLSRLVTGNTSEKVVNTPMEPTHDAAALCQRAEDSKNELRDFSGFTCPECRGPLWLQQAGKLKEFACRVGHRYSFESLLEQHAATTERSLWAAVLALEEEVLLAREAAQQTSRPAAEEYEQKAMEKQNQAKAIRTMLTTPDRRFQGHGALQIADSPWP